MKKLLAALLLIFLSCNEKSCLDVIQCNPLRQQKDKTIEVRITELRERIKDLETDKKKREKNPLLLGDLYNNLGNRYLDTEQWDSAIDAFNKALKNGRLNHVIYYSLGLAYGNRGKMTHSQDDFNKAESNYIKALEMEPGYYTAGYALAVLLFFEKNEKERATAIMEEITAKNKTDYVSRFALGRFYYDMGKMNASLKVYEALCNDLDKLPDSEVIIQYRAQCRENREKLQNP